MKRPIQQISIKSDLPIFIDRLLREYSSLVWTPVHIATKSGTETCPICDDKLSRTARCSSFPTFIHLAITGTARQWPFLCVHQSPIWHGFQSGAKFKRSLSGKHYSTHVSKFSSRSNPLVKLRFVVITSLVIFKSICWACGCGIADFTHFQLVAEVERLALRGC